MSQAQQRGLSRADAEALTKKVLSFATADETRVSVNSGERGNSRFAVNQMSTGGDNSNTTVNVRSVVGRKVGNASTNRLDDAGLKAVVENSERLAKTIQGLA